MTEPARDSRLQASRGARAAHEKRVGLDVALTFDRSPELALLPLQRAGAWNRLMTPNLKWLALRVFRQRFGVEILRSRKNPNLMDFIENRGINLVLDVGANVGQFGLSLRNRGYAGQIMSFEPVSDAFNELKKVASGDDLWGMSNLALAAARASMEINVSENSQFSSFNDLTSTASNFDPEAAFKASESVIV